MARIAFLYWMSDQDHLILLNVNGVQLIAPINAVEDGVYQIDYDISMMIG